MPIQSKLSRLAFQDHGECTCQQIPTNPNLSAAIDSADKIDGHLAHSRLLDQQPIDDSEQFSFSAISKEDVKKAIGNLPDDFRLIVVLSLLEGFSYQEIADIAGIHLETVRSKLHQGRRLMQRELLGQVACEGNYSIPQTESGAEERVSDQRSDNNVDSDFTRS